MPDEDEVKLYLSSTIRKLAEKHHGPEFEPHVTLLGNLPLTLDELEKGCEELASKTSPFQVTTGAVEYSTTYYQCAFVRIKPIPELMNVYDLAKQVFGLVNPSVFMPHISLFYGDTSYSERHKIVESLEFKQQHFHISSIVVTPTDEVLPSEWKHLVTQHFEKK